MVALFVENVKRLLVSNGCCGVKVARLKEDLQQKEAALMEENDRLRHERNDLRARVKGLKLDLENLQRDS